MKKVLLYFVSVLLILGFTACGSTHKALNPNEITGRIIIYTSMYEDVIAAVKRVTERQFPNCDIIFVYGGTGQIQSRITNEMATNRLGCDILMVAEPAYALELREKEMLHPYRSPEGINLAYDHDPEGYWYPVRVSNMVLAYNPQIQDRNSLPNSFADFAYDTSVKGAISMSNPLTSGTTMSAVTALRDKYGYDYFDTLGRQNVVIESSAVAMTKLQAGDYKLIMVLEEVILKERQEKGTPLEIIYPTDGTIIIPSPIMIINEKWSANKNIRAAETILDWFLGEEGQSAIVDGWMHSVRINFSKIPFDSIPTSRIQANSIPVIWENNYRERDDIQARFEQYITNRR